MTFALTGRAWHTDARFAVADGGPADGHRATGDGTGQGLIGMRERAELLGGELHAGPAPDRVGLRR